MIGWIFLPLFLISPTSSHINLLSQMLKFLLSLETTAAPRDQTMQKTNKQSMILILSFSSIDSNTLCSLKNFKLSAKSFSKVITRFCRIIGAISFILVSICRKLGSISQSTSMLTSSSSVSKKVFGKEMVLQL